jgi:hypothetical protein
VGHRIAFLKTGYIDTSVDYMSTQTEAITGVGEETVTSTEGFEQFCGSREFNYELFDHTPVQTQTTVTTGYGAKTFQHTPATEVLPPMPLDARTGSGPDDLGAGEPSYMPFAALEVMDPAEWDVLRKDWQALWTKGMGSGSRPVYSQYDTAEDWLPAARLAENMKNPAAQAVAQVEGHKAVVAAETALVAAALAAANISANSSLGGSVNGSGLGGLPAVTVNATEMAVVRAAAEADTFLHWGDGMWSAYSDQDNMDNHVGQGWSLLMRQLMWRLQKRHGRIRGPQTFYR